MEMTRVRALAQRLAERFLEFGFTREQAEVYVFLLRMGPCPAGMVARRLEINRMKAYRTLNALEKRGLAHRIIGHPVKFVAAPIKETLDGYVDEFRARLSNLETSENEIIELLEKISQRLEPSVEEPRFRIFQGRQQIYDLLVQMCDRAKEEICITTTGNDITRLTLLSIDDYLMGSAQEGMKISVLTQIEEKNVEEIENIIDLIDVRHLSLPAPIRFVIVDEQEALTTVAMDDSMSMTTRNDTGIWTNATSYVTAMKVFFETLWKAAPEAKIIIESMRTGRTPQEIRMITSNEYAKNFSDMVERSRMRVDILVNSIRDLPIFVKTLHDISERKIGIRILTQVDQMSIGDINTILESASVMHLSGKIDLGMLIIDGTEVLLNIQGLGIGGQAIWSNLRSYVETMKIVFEDYWRAASPAREIASQLASQEVQIETLKTISDALEQSGLTAESPGNLVGNSGLMHSFHLVVRNPSNPYKNIALELLTEAPIFNAIIELSVKSSDLKSTMIFLASTIPSTKEESDLAQLYGVKLVQESNAMLTAKKVLDEAKKFLEV